MKPSGSEEHLAVPPEVQRLPALQGREVGRDGAEEVAVRLVHHHLQPGEDGGGPLGQDPGHGGPHWPPLQLCDHQLSGQGNLLTTGGHNSVMNNSDFESLGP